MVHRFCASLFPSCGYVDTYFVLSLGKCCVQNNLCMFNERGILSAGFSEVDFGLHLPILQATCMQGGR